jgi:protein TonB
MSSNRPAAAVPLSPGRALLLAALIECGVVLAAASLMASAATNNVREEPPLLMLVDAPPEPPKEEPKPLPPKPVERTVPIKVAQHVVPAPTPEPPAPAPSDSPIAETPPPPPPPVRSAAAGVDKEAEFAAKLKAAIQAAVSYPPAARSMGFRGKARVEFVFRDGATHQVRIIQSSGIGMIDNAALAAVANALYPAAPESLRGKDMLYQVNVLFELQSAR